MCFMEGFRDTMSIDTAMQLDAYMKEKPTVYKHM